MPLRCCYSQQRFNQQKLKLKYKIKAKIENRNGVDYLSFTPEGMRFPTQIPVITKGSRDEANAWTWNGSLETPTVRPSVRTQYANENGEMVMIHYWLNDGVCQCLSDCTDGNAGKNITLIEVVSQLLAITFSGFAFGFVRRACVWQN